jgi:hypothetical protein
MLEVRGTTTLLESLTELEQRADDDRTCQVQQRPIWVVVLLTILTLGVYLVLWLRQSWSDLQRGGIPLDMSPSSHAWALAMRVDFFSRVNTHFRTIKAQCALRGVPMGVGPGAALAMMTSVVLIPILVANGQGSLSRLWEHDLGPTSRRAASRRERVAITALGLLWAFVWVLPVVLHKALVRGSG